MYAVLGLPFKAVAEHAAVWLGSRQKQHQQKQVPGDGIPRPSTAVNRRDILWLHLARQTMFHRAHQLAIYHSP